MNNVNTLITWSPTNGAVCLHCCSFAYASVPCGLSTWWIIALWL